MKNYPTKIINLITLTFVLFLFFSCATDSDLLTDMVLEDAIINETSINVDAAAITLDEDKAASFNMLNNAASKGARRQYKSSKQPKNGGLVIEKDSIAIYTPDHDFNGKDAIEITLEVTNEDNTTSDVIMTVDVTVNPTKDVVDDKVETTKGSTLLIEPLKNDNFNENSNVKISQISNASKGSVVINDDNTVTYSPNSSSTGIDLFTYTTEVINIDESVTTETGKITVTINNSAVSSTSSGDMGPLKAFPGAEGFGKDATGGRGGKIVEVTTTNFSGPGSLKEALEMSGARTIIFRVGGTIQGQGSEYLQIPSGSGDVTIAGETAPGNGILIRGARLRIRANNVIIKHVRFRQDPNSSAGSNDDALTIDGTGLSSPLKDIIISHCSFSWGLDGNLDIRNTWGATVQNSIITGNAKSNLINANSKNISYLNNIFGLVQQRVVRANTIAHLDLTMEMINNLVYGVPWAGGPSEGLKVTIENNIYENSDDVSTGSNYILDLPEPNPDNYEPNKITNTYLYVNGNNLGDMYNGVVASKGIPYLKNSPLYRSTYTPKPTTGLKDFLLANTGAGQGLSQGLDAVDRALITNIKAKRGSLAYSGTFPTISSGTPYTDSDNDGMDDNWEQTKGLIVGSADNNGDEDGNGYTNLEEFLYHISSN
jgi:hypothetical protein